MIALGALLCDTGRVLRTFVTVDFLQDPLTITDEEIREKVSNVGLPLASILRVDVLDTYRDPKRDDATIVECSVWTNDEHPDYAGFDALYRAEGLCPRCLVPMEAQANPARTECPKCGRVRL